MKKLIGPVILLVILLGILFFIFSFMHVRAPFSLPAQSQGVEITTVQVHDEGDSYTINVQYPQFGIPAIDAQIKKAADDAIAEIKNYPANPPESATPKNSLDGTFDKIYAGPNVISLELILSQYTGGAHPMTIFTGMNFDRATGRKLALADALKMTGLTVNQASEAASAQLRAKLGDAFQFPEGANTNPENFSSFVISGDKITFIFQQYQVAAYSEGPQEVSFTRK